MPNTKEIDDILTKALSSERFAYDYSRSWRFLALTPDEHKQLLAHFRLPSPVAKVKALRKAKRDERDERDEVE